MAKKVSNAVIIKNIIKGIEKEKDPKLKELMWALLPVYEKQYGWNPAILKAVSSYFNKSIDYEKYKDMQQRFSAIR